LATAHPHPQRRDRPAVGVLLVDDHTGFLDAACMVIQATPGFVTVGVARSGEQGVALAADLHPDLVLMDVRMPGLGGVEAARCIVTAGSASAVVLISSDPTAIPTTASECGAVAVMSKAQLRPKTLKALWKDCAGER
jgi:two-component system, NarL family, invasion response regulator UvrY